MKDLATFVQTDERKKVTSTDYQSEEVCLACCVEWLRAVICNFKSYQQSQSQDRMDLLRKRMPEIIANQDTYSVGDIHGKELKQHIDPMVAKGSKRQFRTTHMVNKIGGRPGADDDQEWTIGADEDSQTAPKVKMIGVNQQDKLKAWRAFGDEVFSPGHPYHIILLKGQAPTAKWYHAIAAVSFVGPSGQKWLLVFDPNAGETEIPSSELGPYLNVVAQRCEKGSTLQSVRYIRMNQGTAFSEYF